MNPSRPTTADLLMTECVFLERMQALTRAACRNPARSFDVHCSEARRTAVIV